MAGLPSFVTEGGSWAEDGPVAAMRRRARAFAAREIAPRALTIDAAVESAHAALDVGGRGATGEGVDWAFLRAALREGWLSVNVPRALGGGGGRTAEFAVAVEEMSAACGGLALLVGVNALGLAGPVFSLDAGLWGRVIAKAAAEQHAVPERPSLFAWAISEPSSGTDCEDRRGMPHLPGPTFAERVADGYRLHGRKAFTSNGSIARWVVVHAALDRARPLESWTAFLVDTRRSGFVAARDEAKLGQRASPATETVYEGVFVPERDRVGPEGAGFLLSELILAGSRGPVGAIATGIGRGALEATVQAVRRLPDDHPSSAAQGWVRDALGEMTARLHAARLAYLDAALSFDRDLAPPSWMDEVAALVLPRAAHVVPERAMKRACEGLFDRTMGELERSGKLRVQLARASIAKSLCADTAMWVCDRACDIVPRGAPERAQVEKAFRDVKLTQIYEGTNQLNRLHVADALLSPQSPGPG